MLGLGIPEIIVIALAIAVFFFGGKKIIELSRSMGRMTGEFKKGKMDIEKELRASETSALNETQSSKSEDRPEQKIG